MCLRSDKSCWMMPPLFLGAEHEFFEVWRVWAVLGPWRWHQAGAGACLLSFSPLLQRNPQKQYPEPSSNCTVLIYSYLSAEKKKIVSFQRSLVKMPSAACFWHFQLLLNNSLASVTANVDLKAVVHFSTQMLSRQAWVLTNIFLGLPKATKNEFLVNRLF